MDAKRWVIFGVIVVAVIGGMVYMSSGNRMDLEDIGKDGSMAMLGAEERNGNIADHVRGSEEPKVLIVEYGDFQCPGCRTYSAEVNSIVSQNSEHVGLVYRHFPLSQMHPNARAAAAAAEAAGLQGKFWEMHDLLFENQTEWSSTQPTSRNELFVTYARQLALDEDQFLEKLGDTQITQKINFDVALGRLAEVTGTPAFYVQGEYVQISNDNPTALEDAVNEALIEAGVEVEATEEDN